MANLDLPKVEAPNARILQTHTPKTIDERLRILESLISKMPGLTALLVDQRQATLLDAQKQFDALGAKLDLLSRRLVIPNAKPANLAASVADFRDETGANMLTIRNEIADVSADVQSLKAEVADVGACMRQILTLLQQFSRQSHARQAELQ